MSPLSTSSRDSARRSIHQASGSISEAASRGAFNISAAAGSIFSPRRR
jgi:hypothetical protein